MGEREVVADLRVDPPRPPLLLLLIQPLHLRLLLLLLLPLEGLLDEEQEGGAVDAVTTSHRRHLEERTRGSHVTDRDCLLRLGLLQDARPPTCLVRLLSPWAEFSPLCT